ncbi:MAG TPA: phosphoribosyl-AMP cyclohydrolase [Hyphomicrobiales bacterium]|nr:phosphoribosyl-AMP cyclohydrolase [Kaistiaceae bacterium]HQF30103.1 phosphoribosyl-AMP cyclohydrolase [Hyphomicrobiales bacterium]
MTKTKYLLATAAFAFFGAQAFADEMKPITAAEIDQVQAAWGAGIVAIGEAKAAGTHVEAAKDHIATLYAYDEGGTVLFKPTKAAADQFRGTAEEALSYFVGGSISEDKGFAINPWTKVRFENDAVTIDSDSALAMGNYYFTDPSGKETKVEYSFGYVRGKDGRLKINLHHSSVPYGPK